MILINLKMPIRPDKMEEWLALADSYAKDVNSEDGCLFFQFAAASPTRTSSSASRASRMPRREPPTSNSRM